MFFTFKPRKIAFVSVLLALGFASTAASALVINTINNSASAIGILVPALLAPGSGITVIGGTQTYQGTNTAAFQQSGTYTGFNLAPTSGSTPTLVLSDGIFLTTGNANIPLTNTVNNFTGLSGSGSNALLTTLSGTPTLDANALKFSFSVGAGQNSVSAMFVYGTDEFPTQSVTDIFGFFVDGVNYAKFPNGSLIANNGATNFISNPVGAGLYGIEYNGLSNVLNVVGLLDSSLSVHTISIAIADTSDAIFDSGVFIKGLKAGVTGGCSGIGCNNTVPEPGSLALVGVALAAATAFGTRRRRNSAGKI